MMNYILSKLVLLSSFVNPYTSTEADVSMYYKVVPTISRIVSTGLTFVLILLLTFVPLVTTLDIVYLVVPLAHDKLQEINDKIDKRFHKGEGEHSLFGLLSKQALEAYEESTQTGKNAILIYLRKRLIYYIIVASLVFFAIAGFDTITRLVSDILYKLLHGLGLVG